MDLTLNETIFEVNLDKLTMTKRVVWRIDKSNDGEEIFMLKYDNNDIVTYVKSLDNWVLFKDEYEATYYFFLEAMRFDNDTRKKLMHVETDNKLFKQVLYDISDKEPDLFI